MAQYKVFLVDDEIVVREGIRTNFPWEDTNFVLVGEAPDGEIALNMMQDIKPDILITDIRMPFMDGLALCQVVRQTMPWIYMIIISGYDDFSYAKQAISLGVEEYLLKPVSVQDLLQVLTRIARRIKEDKQQQDNLQSFKDQLASSGAFLKEKLIKEMITGTVLLDVQKSARALQINVAANRYLVMLIHCISPKTSSFHTKERMTTASILTRLADSSGGTAYLCEIGHFYAFLVLGDTDQDIEERAYGLAQAAQFDVARNTSFQLQVAIGKSTALLEDLPSSLTDAQKVMEQMDQHQLPRIMSMEDVKSSGSPNTLPDFSAMDFTVTPIHDQLKYAAAEDVNVLLTRYIESMGDTAAKSTMFADYIYVDILRVASKIIKESEGDPQQVIPKAFIEHNRPLLFSTYQDIYPFLENMLVKAVTFRDKGTCGRYSPTVRKAALFLNEKYTDSSLTLKDVANHVALSNNHFCTVFSQETGITYTEYLTNLRLNRARELLRGTSMRTSEIAYAVGYNDPHYFSYLFKKNVGLSPRDFRKSVQPQ